MIFNFSVFIYYFIHFCLSYGNFFSPYLHETY